MNIQDIEELQYKIELAKYDNLARYFDNPGSQMSLTEIANIGIRSSVLETLSNTNVLLQRVLKNDPQ